ncbi:MAG: DedA family protein [Candidatus Dormibacteraceae bacterium]
MRAIADAIGYPSAAIGILIESAGIPFPGETTLLAVSAYAAAGHLDIRLVVLLGAVGAVAGADFGYLVGRLGGRPFVERFGRILHLNPQHLARSELFFTRYGGRAILAARFVVGLRTWASVLAGMSHMPFWRFQLASAVGAVLWALLIGSIGFFLGRHWQLVDLVVKSLGLGGLAIVLIGAGVVIFLRRRRG